MSRAITGNFPEVIKTGLRDVYFSSIKDHPKEFTAWVNVIKGEDPGGEAGKHFFEELEVASFGNFAAKPEGDPISYDTFIQGNLVRYTPYTFALGTRLTYEMKSDGRYGVFEKLSKELGYAATNAMEVQAHRPLNSGFGTTGGTGFTAAGYDTLALFSSAHTLIRGGTAANRLATDVDLSQTGLELAHDTMQGTVTESGTPDPRVPATLIVPYQSEWIARELLDSTNKPWTNTNDTNVVRNMVKPIFSHYLTDSDAWYLLADKGRHDVKIWIRESPSFDIGDDFDTSDSKMKSMFRMASGHSDWRGCFGSAGA